MTPDQVITAVDKYALEFAKFGVKAERWPLEKPSPDTFGALAHALWMCEETRTIAREDVEKAMRWLGFIQGVLWTTQGMKITDMMIDNTR